MGQRQWKQCNLLGPVVKVDPVTVMGKVIYSEKNTLGYGKLSEDSLSDHASGGKINEFLSSL